MVSDERVRWLDESLVAPGIGDIDAVLRDAGSPHPNASWYFQQLAKLRCFDLLGADATDHVLVVDADIAFGDGRWITFQKIAGDDVESVEALTVLLNGSGSSNQREEEQ